MSVTMTIPAVRAQTKTVTRRHVDTWKTLKPGDRITLIEKGMGLPKGTKQTVICEVEIVDVRVEPLADRHGIFRTSEVIREGLEPMALAACLRGEAESLGEWFVDFWMKGHKAKGHPHQVSCRRIEWAYLP